jgi:hypothetical protein
MSVGVSSAFFGSLLMAFAVLLLMNGVRSRGSIRTKQFTSSGPVWFVIFMFGAFLVYIGLVLS